MRLRIIIIATLLAVALAQEKSWNLKISDPDREGRFLNVPIFYGEWVPITKAKATINSVAAQLEGNRRESINSGELLEPENLESLIIRPEHQEKVETSSEHDEVLERIDETPQITYIDEAIRKPIIGPEPSHFRKLPFQPLPHHTRGHPGSNRPQRRQDRFRANRRNHRKLPPPSQSSGFVNSFSSFFGGPANQAQTTSRPQTTAGFNLGQVFNIPQLLGSKTPAPSVPENQRPGYISEDPVETILYHTPVIKTVEAPDLTKAGPPVIELGGEDERDGGEIIFGQRNPNESADHLSGFYSVDFDGFTHGDDTGKKSTLEKSPKKLSVLVSGLNSRGPVDMKELAKLFKEGKMDGATYKAFISKPSDQAPEGFEKLTLPFLDPSLAEQQKDSLPSVFIAPVGYKVPPGYRGHPLPYDPASLGKPNQQKVSVLHSTEPSPVDEKISPQNPFLVNRIKKTSTTVVPPVSEDSNTEEEVSGSTSLFDSTHLDPSAVVLNKLKLARNRPSLSTFYSKNRSKQTTRVVDNDSESSKKRRRVLTKIVRKPFNPETTTPTSSGSYDLKTTVIKIVNPSSGEEQVEFQTRPTPTVPKEKGESTFDEETTETFTWTTYRPVPEEVEVATTVPPVDDVNEEKTELDSAEHEDATEVFLPTTVIVPEVSSSSTAEPVVTTTTSTTEPVFVYVPTPPNPDHRLDRFRLKNRKPGHKNFASFPALDSEEQLSTSTTATTKTTTTTTETSSTSTEKYGLFRNRLNLRKYGISTYNYESNSASNIFGQRIRARKRPEATWSHDEPEANEPKKKVKTDHYKKKFRPFFDHLYDQLTKNKNDDGDEQSREDELIEDVDEIEREWARRSTTSPNPYTINAEIYEVHPNSRERITTTKATTTTPAPTTTPEVAEGEHEAEKRVDDQSEESLEYVDTNEQIPPLEYVEFNISDLEKVVAAGNEKNEDQARFEPSQREEEFGYNGVVQNQPSFAYGESQREENTWNKVIEEELKEPLVDADSVLESAEPEAHSEYDQEEFDLHGEEAEPEVSAQPEIHRLQGYKKEINLDHEQWHSDHLEENSLPVVNEHTQHHIQVEEDDFIPFVQEGTKKEYVEIQRHPVSEETDDDDVTFIHDLIDHDFNLAEVNSEDDEEETRDSTTPVEEEQVTEEVQDTENTEETTQTIFVTRPTTTIAVAVQEETEPDNQVTIAPEEDTVEVEPQPEGEDLNDHEAEITTTEEHFEVTTFRPKVTGGFFENLGNLLGYILPSRTTTPQPSTTPVEETTFETVEDTTEQNNDEELDQETTPTAEEIFTVEENSGDGVATTEAVTPEEIVQVEEDPNEPLTELQAYQEISVPTTLKSDLTSSEPSVIRFGKPKSIEQEREETDNDFVEDVKTSNISKSVYGAIKREEYLKNWVASRKYHKFTEAGNKHGVIISGTDEEREPSDDVANLPFVPTVLPIVDKEEGSFWETSGVTIKKKRRKGSNSLLDKLSSSRKSLKDSIFARPLPPLPTVATTSATTSTTTSSKPSASPEYPRGSDTKIYKQWQGGSLSQAEFERQVLGVSTATEVSVKSVICVRGRCYNADNVPSLARR